MQKNKIFISFVLLIFALTVSAQSITKKDTVTNPVAYTSIADIITNAEAGDKEAQYQLGVSYAMGDGVVKSATEAIKWWEKAGHQKHAEAEWYLGYYYENGFGVKRNIKKAIVHYKQASQYGKNNSAYDIVRCLWNMYEYDEAERWCESAAEQGNADAMYQLAVCYGCGRGVRQSLKKAMYWYQKAAENGNDDAKEVIRKTGKSEY